MQRPQVAKRLYDEAVDASRALSIITAEEWKILRQRELLTIRSNLRTAQHRLTLACGTRSITDEESDG